MQVVGLELIRTHSFEQVGQQADVVFRRETGKDILKLRDVRLAVIGRKFHADQQCFAMRLADLNQNFIQVAFDVGRAEAAQTVIRT